MEYEIADDPQGLPERLDAERDGGLRAPPPFFRKPATHQPDTTEHLTRYDQLGEIA